MTKELLIAIAAVIPLSAQLPLTGNAFQQTGWVGMEDRMITTVHPSLIEGQSGPVLGKPLSATEVRRTEQLLSDGSHINNSEKELFYRDGMGRMLTKTSNGSVLYDPVAGFTFDVTTWRKTYTKSPISPDSTVTIAAAAHHSSVYSHTGSGKEPGTQTEELLLKS